METDRSVAGKDRSLSPEERRMCVPECSFRIVPRDGMLSAVRFCFVVRPEAKALMTGDIGSPVHERPMGSDFSHLIGFSWAGVDRFRPSLAMAAQFSEPLGFQWLEWMKALPRALA